MCAVELTEYEFDEREKFVSNGNPGYRNGAAWAKGIAGEDDNTVPRKNSGPKEEPRLGPPKILWDPLAVTTE